MECSLNHTNYFGGFSTDYFMSKCLRWAVAFLYFFVMRVPVKSTRASAK